MLFGRTREPPSEPGCGRVVVLANVLRVTGTLAVPDAVDYWRGLYDLLWRFACGDRFVREHVDVCNRGRGPGLGWYISAVVHAAIPRR